MLLLAPTAVNQQKFIISLDGDKVSFSDKCDMLHDKCGISFFFIIFKDFLKFEMLISIL